MVGSPVSFPPHRPPSPRVCLVCVDLRSGSRLAGELGGSPEERRSSKTDERRRPLLPLGPQGVPAPSARRHGAEPLRHVPAAEPLRGAPHPPARLAPAPAGSPPPRAPPSAPRRGPPPRGDPAGAGAGAGATRGGARPLLWRRPAVRGPQTPHPRPPSPGRGGAPPLCSEEDEMDGWQLRRRRRARGVAAAADGARDRSGARDGPRRARRRGRRGRTRSSSQGRALGRGTRRRWPSRPRRPRAGCGAARRSAGRRRAPQ